MSGKTGRLLVVDDNEDNRYTLSERLVREGYADIATATNGREALEMLRSREFDLVLLDIMMPEMNGYQVLEALRADPKRRNTPVIVISAIDQLESAIRCIELGAEDYLPKPFNPILLRARVGAVLEKKRMRDEIGRHVERLDRELKFARDIQLSMVPSAFPPPSAEFPVEIHATLKPAKEIGGDLYDYFWIAPGRLCLAVADVSDKGVSAALYMARTKTALRLLATRSGEYAGGAPTADGLLEQLNEELCRDNPHTMFVALVLCLVDVATGEVEWCNAAHPPPLVVAPDGAVERLRGESTLPLGLRAPLACTVGTAVLAPGASLFIYTDGITEAINEKAEMFGESRLRSVLAAMAGGPARRMLGEVLDEVRRFAGASEASDDIAAMILRWRP